MNRSRCNMVEYELGLVFFQSMTLNKSSPWTHLCVDKCICHVLQLILAILSMHISKHGNDDFWVWWVTMCRKIQHCSRKDLMSKINWKWTSVHPERILRLPEKSNNINISTNYRVQNMHNCCWYVIRPITNEVQNKIHRRWKVYNNS
jgi:hypothetical protein